MASSHKRSNYGYKKQIGPNKWAIRVGVGYKADGKIRQIRKTVYGTEADADAAIRALKDEMGANPTMASGYTLDEFFNNRFIPDRSDLTKTTLDFHQNMWKHVPDAWKEGELKEQSHAAIQRWISSLAPGVAHHAMRTYRAVLRAAWYDDLLPKEPLQKPFRYPRSKKPKLQVWGVENILYVIEHLRGDSMYAIFLCMCGGGLRREEGIALDWEDISFEELPVIQSEKSDDDSDDNDGGDAEEEQAIVSVRYIARVKVFSAITDVEGEKGTKNDASYRIVTLGPTFANPLHDVAKSSGPVCMSRHKRRMSTSQVPKHWKHLFEEGKALDKVPFIPISRLRHTNSTLMRDAQVEDSVIADFHGHTDVQTDKRHYLAPTKATIDGAALTLEEYISAAC
jgi:integrase